MTSVNDIITRFEKFAPLALREDGDPTGFQIGSKKNIVHKMMTTLDVRPEIVQEAINKHVDFIFAHHPVMFRPAKNLDLSNPQNKMYADILKNNITVYAAHTNLDNANGGMNDWLAETIKLQNVKGLVLHDTNINGINHYMGRIGNLSHSMSVRELSELCKKEFKVSGLRLVTNDVNHLIKRVAILGGSGGKFYPIALKKGADLYITGDLYYHTSQDMLAYGLDAIDPGHHIESICKVKLQTIFQKWNQENDWKIEVITSEINTDPFTFA